MKTLEIEVAVMKYFGIRQNLIVPNIHWGMLGLNYECDLVRLSSSNYATEIEIKISKSDLLRDKEKRHYHDSTLFKYLYYAIPEKLKDIALAEIPEYAGLLVVKKIEREYSWQSPYRTIEAKKPIKKSDRQWTAGERYKLAGLGAMRILALKEKLL